MRKKVVPFYSNEEILATLRLPDVAVSVLLSKCFKENIY